MGPLSRVRPPRAVRAEVSARSPVVAGVAPPAQAGRAGVGAPSSKASGREGATRAEGVPHYSGRMRSLMQLAEEASGQPLSEKDIEWLHLLLADWQVLADLAAADLVVETSVDPSGTAPQSTEPGV